MSHVRDLIIRGRWQQERICKHNKAYKLWFTVFVFLTHHEHHTWRTNTYWTHECLWLFDYVCLTFRRKLNKCTRTWDVKAWRVEAGTDDQILSQSGCPVTVYSEEMCGAQTGFVRRTCTLTRHGWIWSSCLHMYNVLWQNWLSVEDRIRKLQ